ncbi:MAG: GTP 3',8-cyclase MoaA [Planctomycetes bacterium]|nr:GTP 3',8-cyclase MoaA [Planctomycetota bacterium]
MTPTNESKYYPPLTDGFGRRHTSLRISVTDRCNIRCFYCMPEENVRFRPREELLTFEEVEQVAAVMLRLGVTKFRLTGGEPLVRANLPNLVQRLASLPGLTDLALTTNGILLADQAPALKAAGLRRLNISLDALDAEAFRRIARRDGLEQVLEGIETARQLGFEKIRLNAVAIRGITEVQLLPLARFARERDLELRFIEFMPLDAESRWDNSQVMSGVEIRQCLEAEFGPLIPAPRPDPSQPATDFLFHDGRGRIGLIHPVTQPFCGDCNRLRITAEGKLRNCLFSTAEWDLRELLRAGTRENVVHGSVHRFAAASSAGIADSEQEAAMIARIRQCVAAKKPGHGIDTPEFIRPERAMYQIGG